MKNIRLFLQLIPVLICFGFNNSYAQKESDLIPFPSAAENHHGHFEFGRDVVIIGNKSSANIFNAWMQMTSGYALPLVDNNSQKQKAIYLTLDKEDSTENYRLTVKKKDIYKHEAPFSMPY